MTPPSRPEAVIPQARRLRVADPNEHQAEAADCLLWGWPAILAKTNVPRRTLEREIVAGRFPKPIRRVGRRPFWRPLDVILWAQGDGRS